MLLIALSGTINGLQEGYSPEEAQSLHKYVSNTTVPDIGKDKNMG